MFHQGDHMHRTAKLSVATLVSCVVVIGCGQGATVGTDVSDRQIFEGVMFGSGPVANLVPEARDHLRPELYVRDSGDLATMADARAKVIDAVESAHPGFLAAFARTARNGDPAQVRVMIGGATSAILEAYGQGRARSKGDQAFNIPVASRGDQAFNIPVASRGDQAFNIPVASRGDQAFNIPVASRGDQAFNIPVSGQGRVQDIRDVHPAWDLFSRSLFTEQLALSVAMTFGRAATER
jgi:SdpC family antimicrobial peptide